MKKLALIKNKRYFYFLLGFFTLLNVGCSTKYHQGELIKPHYMSAITSKEDENQKIPVSIQVKPFDFDSPGKDTNGLGMTLSLIPIVSATRKTPSVVMTNLRLDGKGWLDRKNGEIGKLITEELNKINLFDEVVFNGSQKDFEIRGTVNFKIEARIMFGGLGIIGALPPISIGMLLFTPISSYKYICDAHFDIIDTKTNKVILSEDYSSEISQLNGLFYGGYRSQQESFFGKKVFPPIVKNLTYDLKTNIQQHLNSVILSSN